MQLSYGYNKIMRILAHHEMSFEQVIQFNEDHVKASITLLFDIKVEYWNSMGLEEKSKADNQDNKSKEWQLTKRIDISWNIKEDNLHEWLLEFIIFSCKLVLD